MQKKPNNSGITLIALIITIIVMLILVAVTVNTAVNSGLFGHAKNATQGWKSEEEKESNIGNDNYINDTVNQFSGSQTNPDNKPDRSFLKVGDYIAYNPDTAGNYMGLGTSTSEKAGSSSNPAAGIPQDTTLKWRVMNINDDGSVDLISATPISTSVYFQGSIGYNNGVLLLNELCKTQYSNNTLGVTSRSINLEDIEKNFNSTGIAARNSYTSSGNVQYGNIKTYSENYSYSPDIYDKVGKTTAEESKNYYTTPTTATHTQKGTLEVQQTYYNITTPASYFGDSTFHELIFGTGTVYWLASRYADCSSSSANFGLCGMYIDHLYGYVLFSSSNSQNDSRGFCVRPVVSLGANIKISTDGGTADVPRTISL
jgi:hypothetical protein